QFEPGERENREIAQNVYFDSYGKGYLEVGGEEFNFRYREFKWIEIKQSFDITDNTTTLYVDGQAVHTWPFTYQALQTEGTNGLSAINFYPLGRKYEYFIDNVAFETVNNATDETVEGRNAADSNQLSVFPNPTDGIIIVGVEMTTEEQIEIEIFDSVGKVIRSYKGNSLDFVSQQLDLNNQEDGIYFIRLKSKNEVITKQFLLAR
ncbi:MAG: T9SS type A sorting domain-containing protein, partial [Bacteroidota bacterium]